MQRAQWRILAATVFVLCAIGVAGADGPPVPRSTVSVSRSHAVSAVSLSRAAALGNARAQTQLGYMYETGIGVPQDYHLAALWYHRAAEQGEPRAQHLLGLLLNKGFGVPVNFIESHKWLNLAAAQVGGDDRDYYLRIRNAVASKLTLREIYEAQRRARYWRPLPER